MFADCAFSLPLPPVDAQHPLRSTAAEPKSLPLLFKSLAPSRGAYFCLLGSKKLTAAFGDFSQEVLSLRCPAQFTFNIPRTAADGSSFPSTVEFL